jgi:prophage regulatory protein
MADSMILRLPDVSALTGLSRSTIYRLVNRGEFVRPIKISERCIGFNAGEIAAWVESRQRA